MELGTYGLIVILEVLFCLLDNIHGMPSFWCPDGRYPTETGRCELCYENCGVEGCTGPGSHLGPGGCSSCWLAQEPILGNSTCISPFSACEEGYYRKTREHHGRHMTVCKACHPLCATCSGPGVSYCDSCRYYRWDGICVRVCPSNSIALNIAHGVRTCITIRNTYGRRRPFYLYRDRYRDDT